VLVVVDVDDDDDDDDDDVVVVVFSVGNCAEDTTYLGPATRSTSAIFLCFFMYLAVFTFPSACSFFSMILINVSQRI